MVKQIIFLSSSPPPPPSSSSSSSSSYDLHSSSSSSYDLHLASWTTTTFKSTLGTTLRKYFLRAENHFKTANPKNVLEYEN